MTDKIRVDVSDLSLEEMAEALEAMGDVDEKSKGFNFRQTAALAWVTIKRTNPEFTYEQALKMKIGELDIVEAPPEVPGGATGVVPPLSAVPGE